MNLAIIDNNKIMRAVVMSQLCMLAAHAIDANLEVNPSYKGVFSVDIYEQDLTGYEHIIEREKKGLSLSELELKEINDLCLKQLTSKKLAYIKEKLIDPLSVEARFLEARIKNKKDREKIQRFIKLIPNLLSAAGNVLKGKTSAAIGDMANSYTDFSDILISSFSESDDILKLRQDIIKIQNKIKTWIKGLDQERNISEYEFKYIYMRRLFNAELRTQIDKILISSRDSSYFFEKQIEENFLENSLKLGLGPKRLYGPDIEKEEAALAKKILSDAHLSKYDNEIKQQFVKIAKNIASASVAEPSKLPLRKSYYFLGKASSGKTSAVERLAKILGVPFFEKKVGNPGELSAHRVLGEERYQPDAKLGWLAKALLTSDEHGHTYNNGILLVDDLDAIDMTEIVAFLREYLDPDKKYIDHPFFATKIDISRLTIIITANKELPKDEGIPSRVETIKFPDLSEKTQREILNENYIEPVLRAQHIPKHLSATINDNDELEYSSTLESTFFGTIALDKIKTATPGPYKLDILREKISFLTSAAQEIKSTMTQYAEKMSELAQMLVQAEDLLRIGNRLWAKAFEADNPEAAMAAAIEKYAASHTLYESAHQWFQNSLIDYFALAAKSPLFTQSKVSYADMEKAKAYGAAIEKYVDAQKDANVHQQRQALLGAIGAQRARINLLTKNQSQDDTGRALLIRAAHLGKLEAARMLANLFANSGDFTRSEFWLGHIMANQACHGFNKVCLDASYQQVHNAQVQNDSVKEKAAIETAAKLGDINALISVGLDLMEKNQLAAAANNFRQADTPEARYYLAQVYKKQEQDKKAKALLLKLLDIEDDEDLDHKQIIDDLFELAVTFEKNLGITSANTDAIEIFKALAKKGHVPANLKLGMMPLFGKSDRIIFTEEHINYLRFAKDKQDPLATSILAYLSHTGQFGVGRSTSTATRYFERSKDKCLLSRMHYPDDMTREQSKETKEKFLLDILYNFDGVDIRNVDNEKDLLNLVYNNPYKSPYLENQPYGIHGFYAYALAIFYQKKILYDADGKQARYWAQVSANAGFKLGKQFLRELNEGCSIL